jgi:hypothetical protein
MHPPQVLLELAARAADDPGMAWRVGVGLPVDEVDAVLHNTSQLKGKARNLLARQCKPAVSEHRPPPACLSLQ